MVGSLLCRRLRGEALLQTVGRDQLDLRCQSAVDEWSAAHRPQVVFLAAATVGGITANASLPADFIYENLAIETNVIDAARRTGVQKFLFLSSSCVYPRLAVQPVSEDALLTGALEPTNEWYAVAKIAGLKLCQAYRRQYGVDFISVTLAGLYGAGDNFDAQSSQVIAALILKLHAAKVSSSPRSRCGARARRFASSCTSTTSPMRPYISDGALQRRISDQRRKRRGTNDPRAREDGRSSCRMERSLRPGSVET